MIRSFEGFGEVSRDLEKFRGIWRSFLGEIPRNFEGFRKASRNFEMF